MYNVQLTIFLGARAEPQACLSFCIKSVSRRRACSDSATTSKSVA